MSCLSDPNGIGSVPYRPAALRYRFNGVACRSSCRRPFLQALEKAAAHPTQAPMPPLHFELMEKGTLRPVPIRLRFLCEVVRLLGLPYMLLRHEQAQSSVFLVVFYPCDFLDRMWLVGVVSVPCISQKARIVQFLPSRSLWAFLHRICPSSGQSLPARSVWAFLH